MDIKIRNFHARLCDKYVKKLASEDYQTLKHLAEENYKFGKPVYTLGTIFHQFMTSKQPNPDSQ